MVRSKILHSPWRVHHSSKYNSYLYEAVPQSWSSLGDLSLRHVMLLDFQLYISQFHMNFFLSCQNWQLFSFFLGFTKDTVIFFTRYPDSSFWSYLWILILFHCPYVIEVLQILLKFLICLVLSIPTATNVVKMFVISCLLCKNIL